MSADRHGLSCMTDPCPPCVYELHSVGMCQCGHTRASHTRDLTCFGCGGEKPCDAVGVTVKLNEYRDTWRWNLRCERHGTLEVRGPLDDWEPEAVTRFRIEHAGHTGC